MAGTKTKTTVLIFSRIWEYSDSIGSTGEDVPCHTTAGPPQARITTLILMQSTRLSLTTLHDERHGTEPREVGLTTARRILFLEIGRAHV